jgi:hypothetical protein
MNKMNKMNKMSKMNAKKLVLSFCVLVAVTGGSAHGAAPSACGATFSFYVSDVQITSGVSDVQVAFSVVCNEKDVRDILYKDVSTEEGQRFDSLLEEKNRELRDQTSKYIELCRREVTHVKNALWHEHREHFRREIEKETYQSSRCDEVAKQSRKIAEGLRSQRIGYLADISKAEMDTRVTNGAQAREFAIVEGKISGVSTSELEDIVVNGLKDIAVIKEAHRRHKLAENTIVAIENAAQKQMEWSDRYLDDCSDPDLCRKIHGKYQKGEIGIYSNIWPFEQERDLVLRAFFSKLAVVKAAKALHRRRVAAALAKQRRAAVAAKS